MYGINSDFQKRSVAIYARVSTEHEAQLSALENQVDWYRPILAARPEWTLTAQYIDEGITGTSAEKQLMKKDFGLLPEVLFLTIFEFLRGRIVFSYGKG